ncbi:MAG: DinB family protein, partial [Anaerolineae bacterium]|nr:DinB family protein [Gemmatimonadaceae bacterium]
MGDERRWTAALLEHETVVRAFLEECEAVAPADWQRAPAPGKWSPAAVSLHVCRAYELGRDAIGGGPGMRLLVPPAAAWFAGKLLLPFLLATKRFPRGANAPAEVVPDLAEARLLLQDVAAARLVDVSQQAAIALRHAADEYPAARVTHAFFGALNAHAALRMLSA